MLINDLSARIQAKKQALSASIDRVIDSGWVVLGPEVRNFEAGFASYNNCAHCVSLANGTDAIELGLRAFGVKPGDKVATVANAGMYTTTAILSIGADTFFIDVDLQTKNTTLCEVQRAIQAGVYAVVLTHLYGLATPEIFEIRDACRAGGVFILEDCAQAHGAVIEGHRVGSIGDIGSFSFYPTKNLGALGDGGAIITGSTTFADRVRQLRQYGWSTKYHVAMPGSRNSRLDEMQAAILSVFLPDLDRMNAKRRSIAQMYNQGIKNPLVIVPVDIGDNYVGHLYVVRAQERDSLKAHLLNAGIASETHYPVPDHHQTIFGSRYQTISLPNTDQLSAEILTLPCYPEMSDDQVNFVINAVNAWAP